MSHWQVDFHILCDKLIDLQFWPIELYFHKLNFINDKLIFQYDKLNVLSNKLNWTFDNLSFIYWHIELEKA